MIICHIMIKHGFLEKDIEPSQVHDTIKDLLKKENFAITSDDSGNMMWEIHAKEITGIKLGRFAIINGDQYQELHETLLKPS